MLCSVLPTPNNLDGACSVGGLYHPRSLAQQGRSVAIDEGVGVVPLPPPQFIASLAIGLDKCASDVLKSAA